MKENLLNLARIKIKTSKGFVDPVYVINEDKIDNIIIKRTNDTEVSVKDYLKLLVIDVLQESLAGVEEDKDE